MEIEQSGGAPQIDRPGGRIVLLRGPIVSSVNAFNNEAVPALGLAYVAGYVRARGYDVTLIDAVAEGLNRMWNLPAYPGFHCQGLRFEEIAERIPADVEVIGFSTMFSGEWPLIRDMIRFLRPRFPRALFVAGGEHITALPEYSLRDCPEIDVAVRGEGERTFHDVIVARRDGVDFAQVGGASSIDKASGRYVEGAGLPRIHDVGTIPWPYWPEGYLEKFWAAGKSYGVLTERDMPIMASRGCPYRCTFCSNPQMWTTRYVLREVDDVIAEIEHYVAKHQITSVQFYDLTAITKKRWTIEFCRKILEKGIKLKWSLPSGTRSEALDAETLAMLKATGCTYMAYIPESGSEETLKAIKKQISLDKLVASAMEAKRLGMTLRSNLIIGFPHETRRHVFESIGFGLRMAAKGIDEVVLNIFSPYPGTEIFADLLARGVVKLDDAYFLGLTSLNSDYTAVNPLTVNPHIGPRELAAYRLISMLVNYAISYLFYPARILRTLRNLLPGSREAETVLEHRLRDMLGRKKTAG
ncbi:MAG: B12-binding domain-containing radical SAM protein [Alphaproteobacteria bacterium]|nr:B12-binding domain-containing radical SAM protein [Alphaproteobacteria bacterium]